MRFDKNINENRDVKCLECDYLLVQWCVKLTLDNLDYSKGVKNYLKLDDKGNSKTQFQKRAICILIF